MLRCVGFFEKFCRPLNVPPDYTLESVKNVFQLKFPELPTMDTVLIQICRKRSLCVLDVELGEYLDWDEETTLNPGSKIRASQLASTEPPPPPAPGANAAEV
ncbi:unnamed protein product [Ixodes hexagonus]